MTRSSIDMAAQELSLKLSAGLAGPLEQLLQRSWIEEILREEGHPFRHRIFTPWVTVWAFVGQVLDADYSLRNAVTRVQAILAGLGLREVSNDTGAYCKARYRLPAGLLAKLCRRTGHALTSRATQGHLWHGRRVKIVDGSSVSMPDTDANQEDFPQPSSQAPGVGFPVARIVGVFCMATGASLDLAIESLKKSELALFRMLRPVFQNGDVMLADRLYSSFADIVLLSRQGVDTVARMSASRRVDFRRGHILGIKDHLVTWPRPKERPMGLRATDYRLLPVWIQVRELRFRVVGDGFRPLTITLVTTLLDADEYPAEEVAKLYLRRWEVETDLAHLKTTLGMDVVRGQKPEMVRKEIWVHALTYNLLRTLMWSAAEVHGEAPLRISIKGTAQHVRSFAAVWNSRAGVEGLATCRRLLLLVAREKVPDRPGRVEPHERKRRPKPYKLMTKPRAVLQERLRSA
jgi:hypothetical protein